MLDDLDLGRIADPVQRRAVGELLNLVEEQAGQIAGLKAEVQRLRDALAHLKGEQGQPRVLPNKRPVAADHSSEQERREPRPGWHKGSKQARLVINRTEERRLERATLPADAVFKGYAEVVVQEVVLRPEVIRFRCERWYSPGEQRTYQAALPPGYHGQFGPDLKALALYLTYETNVSQAKLLALFTSVGVDLSAGHLAALLTQQPALAAEYDAICLAGLLSSAYQHIDETPTRVGGVTRHCHILGAPRYTAYRTTPGLDRQAVLDVLRAGRPRCFRLNAVAWAFLDQGKLPQRTRAGLLALPQDQDFDEPTFQALLAPLVPASHPALRRFVLEGAAIGAYHAQTAVPVIQTLIADGAWAWQSLTEQYQLCWVHEGRHYKKLCPVLAVHRDLLTATLGAFWAYYHELRAYQAAPTTAEAVRLAAKFDTLFSQQTGYAALDDCLRRTLGRKTALLLVLAHPELPLHNNPAELAARRRVRKRDASFGARSDAGIATWDALQTILATANQLGVNALHYLQDRLSAAFHLPALADLIAQPTATCPAPT